MFIVSFLISALHWVLNTARSLVSWVMHVGVSTLRAGVGFAGGVISLTRGLLIVALIVALLVAAFSRRGQENSFKSFYRQ